MQNGIYLITGGTRSGKSLFAEKLVKSFARPVTYLATAVVTDKEMEERVQIHKERRDPSWLTYEEPYHVPAVLKSLQGENVVVLLDCLSVYLSNLVWKTNDNYTRENYQWILNEVKKIITCVDKSDMSLVIVSSEIGLGVVPSTVMGRFYRDLLGEANQILAQVAREVYLVISGLPIELKKLSNLTCERQV